MMLSHWICHKHLKLINKRRMKVPKLSRKLKLKPKKRNQKMLDGAWMMKFLSILIKNKTMKNKKIIIPKKTVCKDSTLL
jgi:hypothetical protein